MIEKGGHQMTRRIQVVLGLAFLGGLAAASLAARRGSAAATPAALTVEGPREVLGPVRQGQQLSAGFRLTNATSVTIHANRVETTCTCTVPEGIPQEFKPGEVRDVTLAINTKNSHGRETFRVRIYDASLAEPVGILSVDAMVSAEEVNLSTDMGMIRAGFPFRKEVVMRDVSGSRVESIEPGSGPDWKVSVNGNSREDQLSLTISGIAPPIPEGKSSETVGIDRLIRFRGHGLLRARIFATASSVPEWSLPRRVLLGCSPDRHERAEASFLITHNKNHDESFKAHEATVARTSSDKLSVRLDRALDRSFKARIFFDRSAIDFKGETIEIKLIGDQGERIETVHLIPVKL